VGEEVETGHETNGEDAELPFELESAADLAHELLGLLAGRHGASTCLLSDAAVVEELRLGEAEADEGGEEGSDSTEVEEDACVLKGQRRTEGGTRKKGRTPVRVGGDGGEVDDAGEEVTDGVTIGR
jgi:hypothetical protein